MSSKAKTKAGSAKKPASAKATSATKVAAKKDTRSAPAAKKADKAAAKGGVVSKLLRALVGGKSASEKKSGKPESKVEARAETKTQTKTSAKAETVKTDTKAKSKEPVKDHGKDHGKNAPIAPVQKPDPKAAKPAVATKAPAEEAPRMQMSVDAIRRAAEAVGAGTGASASPKDQAALAKQQKEETAAASSSESDAEAGPLLDLSDAAVKKMIRGAKKRGYVTYDQLNEVMPSEEVTSEKIEDVLAMLNEMGINVVEAEEAEEDDDDDDDDDTGTDLVESGGSKSLATTKKSVPGERTDDPVRMYLREMGSVELLSREGEIAIAKRIEAGREAMIAGLCESPLTFQAIIIWRDELAAGKVLLRDIIDLEATFAGPEAKQAPAAPETEQELAAADDGMMAPPEPAERAPSAPPERPGLSGQPEGEPDEDEEDMENAMSLASMEAELKPKVVETFDGVADAYKRLRKLQDQNVEFKLKNDSLSPSQERRSKKLREELIALEKSLSLNQGRIDALVEML